MTVPETPAPAEAFVADVTADIGRRERKHGWSLDLHGRLRAGDRKSNEPLTGRRAAIDQLEKDSVQLL